MLDKAKLGKRYACYECGTKFYDMNRPAALCPQCQADQANAPVRDIRSLLSGGGRKYEKFEDDEDDAELGLRDEDEDADEEDDDDLLGVDDEDDEGAGEEEPEEEAGEDW